MKVGKKLWLGSTLVACFLIGLQLLTLHRSADAVTTISPWLSPTLPSLDKVNDLDSTEPYTPNNTGNQNCQQREVITRPARLLPIPQTKQSHTSCVVDTSYGAFSTSSYLQRQGSTVAGKVLNAIGGSTIMMPIPFSSTGLTLGGSLPYGYYMFFWDNLDTTLSSSAIYDGTVTHKLPAVSPVGLRDKSGNLLAAEHSSMSFSANGDWMVVDMPFIGAARINTKTREVLPFGTAINYAIGLGPTFRTAISPDGRYAFVASANFGILRLYDLSTCGPVPNTITTKVACSSKDLLPLFMQKLPTFNNISAVRFRGDYTLDVFVGYKVSNITKLALYTLTADGQQSVGYQYLALGDSFASGEGAYQYKAMTDVAENKCHLSQRSYPYLISSALGFGQYESVACSGAKTEDFLRNDKDYEGQVKDGRKLPERDLEKILVGFLPGYVRQQEFIGRYQPNIITLSAVGNDIGFADKIIRCIDTDTCYSSYEDRLEIVNEVNAQFYRLVDLYTQLKTAGDPRAKIYVIGYPQITYPDGNCAANVHLNHDELIFANQLVSYLNSVVKIAAANAGVAYIDVEDALTGHRLCETSSWDVAVNGLTAGNDIVNLPFVHGPIGNESFHPNALGQELLKAKILQQTRNFTLAMPAPNPALTINDPSTDLDFLQIPKSNRVVRIIQNKTGTNGGVMKIGETWVTQYSGLAPLIKARSTVHGWLNSEPVDLGTFTTDSSGSLTVQVTLPESVPPGFHTLHLYGKNTNDEDIDLYETVYVSSNTGQTCMVVATSKQDTDKDNIDDACDPLIDQPPLIVEPDPIPQPLIEAVDPPETPAIDPQIEVIVDNPSDLLHVEETESPTEQITENPQPTNNTETKVGPEHQFPRIDTNHTREPGRKRIC